MLNRNRLVLVALLAAALFVAVGFPTSSRMAEMSRPLGGPGALPPSLQDDRLQAPSAASAETASAPGSAPDLSLDTVSLNVARRNHTAAGLPDGRVLIIGGDNAAGPVSEVEILSASSRGASVVAALAVPRTQHVATLLPDGRVLVTGGAGNRGLLNSSEIFDPSDESMSPGPHLRLARAGHTATVLDDGRVLIAGGREDGTAELFDPARNRFVLIRGKMAEPRTGHSAILLDNGSVLLVGGEQNDGSNAVSAEVFDSSTLTFSPTANVMMIPRTHATLRALPDGKVQVIGGDVDGSMEVYDPTSRRFGAAAHLMPTADLFPLPEMLSSQTRAAFIESASYRELNAKRPASRLKDVIAALKGTLGRSQYAAANIIGVNQAVLTGGVDDEGNLVRSEYLLKTSAASVTTDKVEYLPGEAPVISGAGWKPFEKITIVRQEGRLSHKRTVLHAVANEIGDFICKDLQATDYKAWVAYTLTARGEWSEQVAQTTYADAPPPGKELESLPKSFEFKIPIASRDISVETDAVLFVSRAKSPATASSRARKRGGLSPQSLSCSVPTGSIFNFNPDFTSILNQPCFGISGNPCSAIGDIRLTDACLALSGTITGDVCFDLKNGCGTDAHGNNVVFSMKLTVEEDFQGGAALDAIISNGGSLTALDIPIPGASIDFSPPFPLSVLFSGHVGLSVRGKIKATVNSPFEVKPQFFLSEGYQAGFDSKQDPAFFSSTTTQPNASGDFQVVTLGNGDLKVSIGPDSAFTLDAIGVANVDFGAGVFGFIDAAISNAVNTQTCTQGQLDLTAGADLDADAKLILFGNPIVDEHPSLTLFSLEIPGFPKTLTIKDTEAVNWTNVVNITQGNDLNQCGATVTYNPTPLTTGCSGLNQNSITISPPSGSFFPVGTTIVRLSAATNSGVTGTSSFTVTINDTQAPNINSGAVAAQSANVDTKCSAPVPDVTALVRAQSSDNCTPPSLLKVAQNPAAGATVSGVGNHPIAVTVTDGAGNSSTSSVGFDLIDNFTPVFATHPPVAAPMPNGQACGVLNYKLPVASDPCGAQVVCVPPSGSCFPAGVTKVMCTGTNPSGVQGFTSFNVIGTDTCLQDDRSQDYLQWSSMTGDYLFTHCGGVGSTPPFTMQGKGVPGLVSYTRTLNDTQSDRKITVLYLTNQFTGHGNISIILGGGLSQNYFLNQTNPHPTCACPQASAALVEPALEDRTTREDPRRGSSLGAAVAQTVSLRPSLPRLIRFAREVAQSAAREQGQAPKTRLREPHSRQDLG